MSVPNVTAQLHLAACITFCITAFVFHLIVPLLIWPVLGESFTSLTKIITIVYINGSIMCIL